MKKNFRKFHPRLINYRSYKNFSNETFRECLLQKLSTMKGYKRACALIFQVLNQAAPQKLRYILGNQMSFMTKKLSIEIMKSSRLCNNFLRNRAEKK